MLVLEDTKSTTKAVRADRSSMRGLDSEWETRSAVDDALKRASTGEIVNDLYQIISSTLQFVCSHAVGIAVENATSQIQSSDVLQGNLLRHLHPAKKKPPGIGFATVSVALE